MVALLPLRFYLSARQASGAAVSRGVLNTELLSGAELIKYSGRESCFLGKIALSRRAELGKLRSVLRFPGSGTGQYDKTSHLVFRSTTAVKDGARGRSLATLAAHAPQGRPDARGENGSHLSISQRRRFALARALYSRSRCVLLDDCLAGLEAATAASVADYDGVMVLSAGTVAEEGSPEQLLSKDDMRDPSALFRCMCVHSGELQLVDEIADLRTRRLLSPSRRARLE